MAPVTERTTIWVAFVLSVAFRRSNPAFDAERFRLHLRHNVRDGIVVAMFILPTGWDVLQEDASEWYLFELWRIFALLCAPVDDNYLESFEGCFNLLNIR